MADCKIETVVTGNVIDVGPLIELVQEDTNGAMTFFLGTVRNTSGMPDREGGVVRLEYEAYGPMAEKELRVIAEESAQQFQVSNVVVHHRVGRLGLGEVAVMIAVGAPHRAAAFDACRYVIEELKKRVPIWKKEVFENGAVWVDPHP